MLRSFHVQNWRDFNSLSIKGLDRVNLVVGQNGVGKTALLEALWLYHHRFASAEVHRLLSDRDEHHLGDAPLELPTSPPLRLEALLYRRGAGERALTLQSDPGTLTAHLLLADEVLTLWNTGAFSDLDALCCEVALRGVPPHLWQVRWEAAQEGAHGLPLALPDPDAPLPEPSQVDLFEPPPPSRPEAAPGAFLRAAPPAADSLNRGWEAAQQPHHTAAILQSLKRLEPRLKRLIFQRIANQPHPRVILARQTAPLPLRSLGAGVSRLFELHLALLQAAHGVLLLDAVELGFHPSAYPHLWETILTRARVLHVQVFAGTHSSDCARALAAASERSGEEATLVRLSRLRGTLQVETGGVAALQTFSARGLEVQ